MQQRPKSTFFSKMSYTQDWLPHTYIYLFCERLGQIYATSACKNLDIVKNGQNLWTWVSVAYICYITQTQKGFQTSLKVLENVSNWFQMTF